MRNITRRTAAPGGGCITRMLCLWFVAQLTCTAGGSRARAEDAVSLARAAQHAYQRDDYPAATRLLQRAKAVDPGWHEVDFNLAVTAEAARDYPAAAAHFRQYAAYLEPNASREVRQHADQLEAHGRALSDKPEKRGGFPWWGWVLAITGGLLVLGVIAQQAGSSEDAP